MSKPEALRSVHTTSFPAILRELGVSLFVTTYQAGKLVIVRADGDQLNTHFRAMEKPMGLALDRGRLAIGTARHITEFRDVPAAAAKLPPAGKHDACFLPRRAHVTGDIDIHEMAWAGDDLWFVNTRFSCLCTADADHSFVPRWRPPFVSALAPEDRCHLNGLALSAGRPKYVTALGSTDTAGGWRAGKARGGLLLDVDTGEPVLTGLSMPHSPRLRGDDLWLLESGDGSIGKVDVAGGTFRKVAELPGFTRGLDFGGKVAFVGLSQVRESAVFSGIPITQRLGERVCGVWAVHVETGHILAFLQFEAAVQEIFAVQVVPGTRFPDLVNDDNDVIGTTYVLPDQALQQVPRSLAQ